MKKQFSLLSVIVSLLICESVAFAQNVEFEKANFPDKKSELKEAKRNIDEGDGFYSRSEAPNSDFDLYHSAIPFYLKANNFNPNNALLNYKIGVCYIKSDDNRAKSLSYLEKAFKLNPDVEKNIHYYLGIAFHLNMQFETAIKEFQTARGLLKTDQKGGTTDIDKRISECRNGIELVKNPALVFIDNVGPEINSPYSDYSPVISADESVMMFTSKRNSSTGSKIDPFRDEYFEDIYISTKQNGKWSTATNMGKPINTDDHDATVGLSADGQKLFIYLGNKGGGDLFECDLKGSQWGKPESLGKNINSDSHEPTASLSADGKTLYFVSNRPGGFGDHDIYKSTWDDKKQRWGEAQNLGPTINTPYSENSAFIHPDGKTLYFSSKGHNSMGGFDIFKSVWNEKTQKWSTPENLGYPINTSDDDVYFVLSANGKHAYYSSCKDDSYGGEDIYMVTFITPKNPVLSTEDNLLASITEPVKETEIAKEVAVHSDAVSILKGTIFDALVTTKMLEADIELVDNGSNQVIATFKSNSATGKYLVSLPAGKNYGIAVKKEGYLFHSENFDIPMSAVSQEYVKDIGLNNISVGQKIVLRNIFFDFAKATLRPESTSELERLIKLMSDVPTLKIEIGGHTDSKGSDELNMKLSASRAQSVVDYLASHGIDKSRLTSKGYGKTKPIATNDTDEGRQLNRRTEFEIKSK